MTPPHKYGATPRDAAGLTREQAESLGLKFTRYHDSTKEARRHWELQQLQESGELGDLEWQPRYPLIVNEQLICTYVADAAYTEQGVKIVEDVKGHRTPVYQIKRKLMFAIYGIEIRET